MFHRLESNEPALEVNSELMTNPEYGYSVEIQTERLLLDEAERFSFPILHACVAKRGSVIATARKELGKVTSCFYINQCFPGIFSHVPFFRRKKIAGPTCDQKYFLDFFFSNFRSNY